MIRTTTQPNSHRLHPLSSDHRTAMKAYTEEALYVSQGRAMRAQLNQLVHPFAGLFVKPASDVTGIRYKQDSGAWQVVAVSSFPDLVTEAQAVEFTPVGFAVEVVFTLEITAGSIVVTREVDILCDVVAGRDKVAERNALICPFFDASFAVDGDELSGVEYQVDLLGRTPIPTAFGADLADRARNFAISFDSAGEKRLTLYVTDNTSALIEFSDTLIVRVS